MSQTSMHGAILNRGKPVTLCGDMTDKLNTSTQPVIPITRGDGINTDVNTTTQHVFSTFVTTLRETVKRDRFLAEPLYELILEYADKNEAGPIAEFLSMQTLLQRLGWDDAITLILAVVQCPVSAETVIYSLKRCVKHVDIQSTREFTSKTAPAVGCLV